MADSNHWQRPEPSRQEPHRNGWAHTNYVHEATNAASSTVQEAIHLGYRVIEDNIEQGKAFASRYSKASGSTSSTQDELFQLSAKMIQLGREVTSTYFDALDKLLDQLDSHRSSSSRNNVEDNSDDEG